MMTKNALKLVSANFYTFWKMLLYRFIVALITVGLIAIVFPSISYAFSTSGFVAELEYYISNVSVLPNSMLMLRSLFDIANTFVDGVVLLMQTNTFAFVYTLIVITFLLPFLTKLGDMAFGECIYSYMASLSKTSFFVAYIKKMATSVVYATLKSIFSLIITAILCVGGYFLLRSVDVAGVLLYFMPVIFSLFIILVLSLSQTVVSGWMPASVVFSDGAIKGFAQGFKTVSRRFFKTFSNLLVINFIAFLLVYAFNVYVLIILIPLYALYILTFQMVMFFGSHGMRYYVDLDTILTPKKLETYDKMRKVKHII